MAERLGTCVGPAVIGARQQVIEQFTAKVQLQLGKVALMGQLESQYVATEPQGEQLVVIDLSVGVDERENTEYLRVRLDQDGYPVARAYRLGLRIKQVEELFAVAGIGLRIAQR